MIPAGGKRESNVRRESNANALNCFNFNPSSIKKQSKNSNVESENLDPTLPEGQNSGLNLLKSIYALIKNPNNKEEESVPGSMVLNENEDIMTNFEIGKNYKEYFPHNNLEAVLETFKRKKFQPPKKLISEKRKKHSGPETDINVKVNNFMRGGTRNKPFLFNFMRKIVSSHEDKITEEN